MSALSRRNLGPLLGSTALVLAGTSASAAETEQLLTGELLLEGINQQNYTDGNDDSDDRSAQMWIRAQFGATIDFDEFAEIDMSVVYDGEAGDSSGTDSNDSDEVAFNDAYLTLKRFIRDDIHVRIGRQPVAWNLRSGYGAFLHDSRANKPTVTSWDGARAYWQTGDWTAHGFMFLLDEANESQGLQPKSAGDTSNSRDNTLWGFALDYEPDSQADHRLFFTFSATLEEHAPVGGGTGLRSDELITYYLGFQADLANGFDIYGEGARQDGELSDGSDHEGFGLSVGLDWHVPAQIDTVVGIQVDYLSGDDDPTDGDFEGFSAPHEGTSDTLIVEHERYGELSELLVGNLQAIKLKNEMSFLEDLIRIKTVLAQYELVEEIGGEDSFGTEIDFTFDWQYTHFVNLSLMGGLFIPDDGYEAAASSVLGTTTDSDEIYFLGAGAQVTF